MAIPGITFRPADLSLMREAHRVGDELPAEQLDLVLFTTGIVAGPARQQTSEGMAVHANTVAGNEILVLDAARRYPGTGYFGLNPGFIKSGIRGNLLGAGSFRHRLIETTVGLVTPSADAYAARLTPVLFSPTSRAVPES